MSNRTIRHQNFDKEAHMADWTGVNRQHSDFNPRITWGIDPIKKLCRVFEWQTLVSSIRKTFDLSTSLKTAAVLATVVLGAATVHHSVAETSVAYGVSVNGQYIGATKDMTTVEKALSKLPLSVRWDIQVMHTDDVESPAAIEAAVWAALHPKVPAVEIVINGNHAVALPDMTLAQQAIARVLALFGGQAAHARLMQTVQFRPAEVPSDQVVSVEDAVKILTRGTRETRKYIVSRGDSLWSIAARNGMTVSQLLAANPQVTDEDFVREGEAINVIMPHPLLTVETVETATRQVSIPYTTQYVEDANLARGTTRVAVAGQNGLETEEVKIYKENGNVVKEEVLRASIIQEPVTQVVHKGTRAVPEDTAFYAAAEDAGGWIWPTTTHIITSPYHEKRGSQYHPGVDIGAPYGAPIYASHSGVVIAAGWNNGGYGNWVELDNGNGIVTIYGHMSQVLVVTGQTVSQGQVIGRVGATGEATGPHLHYEVHRYGQVVAPYPYM
jgi:murein DD-endopeptidase MepM/ murein hydrolase activator NlpD